MHVTVYTRAGVAIEGSSVHIKAHICTCKQDYLHDDAFMFRNAIPSVGSATGLQGNRATGAQGV
jgi:hypothetical protein